MDFEEQTHINGLPLPLPWFIIFHSHILKIIILYVGILPKNKKKLQSNIVTLNIANLSPAM